MLIVLHFSLCTCSFTFSNAHQLISYIVEGPPLRSEFTDTYEKIKHHKENLNNYCVRSNRYPWYCMDFSKLETWWFVICYLSTEQRHFARQYFRKCCTVSYFPPLGTSCTWFDALVNDENRCQWNRLLYDTQLLHTCRWQHHSITPKSASTKDEGHAFSAHFWQ